MKIKLKRDDILKYIQQLHSIIDPKHHTVLSMFLVETVADECFITATDNRMQLRVRVPAEVVEEGSCTVPAKKFYDICRALAAKSKIQMTLKDEKLKLVTTGQSRKQFTLASLPVNQFPLMEPMGEDTMHLDVDIETTINAFRLISFSMGVEDHRHFLNGALWRFKEGDMSLVSSDGNRLSIFNCDLGDKTLSGDSIIPTKTVEALIKLLGKETGAWGITIGERQISLGGANAWEFKGKLIDGNYIDYERVIPLNNDKVVELDREAALESFKCATLLVEKDDRAMELIVGNGELTLKGGNLKSEKFEETITVNYGGEQLHMGINVSYVTDIFETIDEEIVIMEFNDERTAILVYGKDTNSGVKYVLMPMRIN